MSKWDLKELTAKLQESGLPVLEDGAVKVVNVLLDWVQSSIEASPSKMDDYALMALPLVRSYALKLVDQIADQPKKVGDQASNEMHPIGALPMA